MFSLRPVFCLSFHKKTAFQVYEGFISDLNNSRHGINEHFMYKIFFTEMEDDDLEGLLLDNLRLRPVAVRPEVEV